MTDFRGDQLAVRYNNGKHHDLVLIDVIEDQKL